MRHGQPALGLVADLAVQRDSLLGCSQRTLRIALAPRLRRAQRRQSRLDPSGLMPGGEQTLLQVDGALRVGGDPGPVEEAGHRDRGRKPFARWRLFGSREVLSQLVVELGRPLRVTFERSASAGERQQWPQDLREPARPGLVDGRLQARQQRRARLAAQHPQPRP